MNQRERIDQKLERAKWFRTQDYLRSLLRDAKDALKTGHNDVVAERLTIALEQLEK